MARPQFSKMLVDRRRDLGLTIEQASRVLKMKQQVLTAFEEGDWDRIPRSGYAQGMLSSYSRYLGLNPRNVIDQFKQDLYAYSHATPMNGDRTGTQSSGEHRRLAGYADRYLGQGQGRIPPSGDIDLYGSAGPAGSIMSSGTFDEEMYRRLARERGGHRGVGYSERYLEQSDDDVPARQPDGRRPYTNQLPDRGSATRRRSRQERSSLAASKARVATRSTIQTHVIDDSFEDDLRYDRASGYEAASSLQGRRDSRHIAHVDRPNVHRTDAYPQGRPRSGGDGRGGRRGDRGTGARPDRPRRSGRGQGGRKSSSQTPSYLSFDARTLMFIVIGLFILLMVFAYFSIGSCVANVTNAEKPQVPVAEAPAEVDDATSTDTEANASSGTDASMPGGTAQATATSSLAGTVSKAPSAVTVSVDDGKVSWVEVVMGDVSLVAQTVSGPWEQTYQVTGPMEIQASDASVVHVTADGTPVSFDSKASGVGIIAIAGPEVQKANGEGQASDAATSADEGGADGYSVDAYDEGGEYEGYAQDAY